MTRTLAAASIGAAAGPVVGVGLGWLAAELRHGRQIKTATTADRDDEPPPFAVEMAGTPRQPGEWL